MEKLKISSIKTNSIVKLKKQTHIDIFPNLNDDAKTKLETLKLAETPLSLLLDFKTKIKKEYQNKIQQAIKKEKEIHSKLTTQELQIQNNMITTPRPQLYAYKIRIWEGNNLNWQCRNKRLIQDWLYWLNDSKYKKNRRIPRNQIPIEARVVLFFSALRMGYPEIKSLSSQEYVFRKIISYGFTAKTRLNWRYRQWKILKNRTSITDVEKWFKFLREQQKKLEKVKINFRKRNQKTQTLEVKLVKLVKTQNEKTQPHQDTNLNKKS